MKIQCKATAMVKKFMGAYNEGNDGTVREVDLELGRTREQFAETFGDELTDVVFAAYVEDTHPRSATDDEEVTEGVWQLKAPTPSKRVVCEMHRLTIEGETVTCQPRLRKFEPVEGVEKVIAVIRITLGQTQVALRQKLEDCIGCDVTIDIAPSMQELPGMTVHRAAS